MTQYQTTFKVEGSETRWGTRVNADSATSARTAVKELHKDRTLREIRVRKVRKGDEAQFGVLNRDEGHKTRKSS